MTVLSLCQRASSEDPSVLRQRGRMFGTDHFPSFGICNLKEHLRGSCQTSTDHQKTHEQEYSCENPYHICAIPGSADAGPQQRFECKIEPLFRPWQRNRYPSHYRRPHRKRCEVERKERLLRLAKAHHKVDSHDLTFSV